MALALGISLDAGKLKEMVDDNASLDWYTILATGQVNNVEKRVLATFNLGSNQMVYFREE